MYMVLQGTYLQIHRYTHTHTHIYIYIYIYIWRRPWYNWYHGIYNWYHMYIYIYVYIYICIWFCKEHIHRYIDTLTHTHTHTHTHIYIYICVCIYGVARGINDTMVRYGYGDTSSILVIHIALIAFSGIGKILGQTGFFSIGLDRKTLNSNLMISAWKNWLSLEICSCVCVCGCGFF